MKPQSNQRKQLKCFVISDTHEELSILERIAREEEGDVFIHAGDFTYYGQEFQFLKFIEIMGSLKFKHKIVISGNHQIALDDHYINQGLKNQYLAQFPCKLTKSSIIARLKEKGCIYLEHQSVTIENVVFFGSPFTPYFCGSSFQYKSQYDQAIWSGIPQKVDVLITHGPPYGILDKNVKGVLCGTKALRKYSLLRKPKFHLFGHIHQAQGHVQIQGIWFANVAVKGINFYV